MSILDTKRKRDIKRQRGQFIAVGVTILLGVLLFASSYNAYLNLDDSYSFTYDRLEFADISIAGAGGDFASEVAAVEGVDLVDTRFRAEPPMRVGDKGFIGRVSALPPTGQPLVNKVDVIEGSGLDPDDDSAVLVETHMAEMFDVGVGDTVEVLAGQTWTEVHIVGIAESPEYIWPARDTQDRFPLPFTFGVLFVSDNLFEGVPTEIAVPDVLVTYEDDVDVAALDEEITELALAAGDVTVLPREIHPSHAVLQLDVQGFEQLSIMFPALFMTAAGLSAFVLLTRLVVSQRSQIGTMRASGMGRRQILRHYLSYGTRLGFWAALIGLVVGIPLAYVITTVYTQELGIPDTVTGFHWVTVVIGFVFGVGAGALGAWAPARSAFKISPAEAMRGDVPAAAGEASLLERIVPPLRSLPVRWLMVLRGIGRNKRRSLSTVFGVVLAMMLVMVSWGMIDTMRWLIDTQFNTVATEDLNAFPAIPDAELTASDILAIDGVDHVEVIASLEANLEFNGETYSTAVNAYSGGSELHGFPDGLPSSGVLVGQALEATLEVGVGDTITVGLPSIDVSFETTVEGFLDEPVGTYAYIDRSYLEGQLSDPSVLDQPGVSQVKASFDNSAGDGAADRQDLVDEIRALDSVAAAFDARLLYNLIEDFVGFFYAFVGIMLVFGGTMAFSLMFNTISVNVAERSGEFATMRANGLTHRSIAGLIAVENLLLTTLGVVPGILVGLWIGAYFTGAYSSDAFTLDFRVDPMSIAFISVAMMLVAVLSLIPALRTVKKLEIGTVVRERAA